MASTIEPMAERAAVYIISVARTPIGSFLGRLSNLSATELGSIAIKGAVQRAGIQPYDVEEVYLGNVLSAGLGQGPARQAADGAGIPSHATCTTINKVCASSLKAIIIGAQSIMLGTASVVVAGGAESMSNAPHYLPQMRKGTKYGDQKLLDAVLMDGLTDPCTQSHMGSLAELCATEHNLTKQAQDDYAIASYRRAQATTNAKQFKEMVHVELVDPASKLEVKIEQDEEVEKIDEDRLRSLKSAFQADGSVTAGNAAPLNDGAAAVVLMSEAKLKELGVEPLAKILGWADAERKPQHFTIAPSLAIPKAIKHAGLAPEDVEYYEINEAFSAVALANIDILGLSREKVNVFGGSVALGHPLGCSGARIVATLTSVLQARHAKVGCAGICNGGGGASAIVIENLKA